MFARVSPATSPSNNADSSSPRQVTRPVPQRSNRSFGTLSPETNGGDAVLGEGENAGPYAPSQATARGTTSGVGYYRSNKGQGGQSDGHIGGKQSHRSRVISAPSPIPTRSHPFNFDGVQRGQARDKSSESHLHRAELIHGITVNI